MARGPGPGRGRGQGQKPGRGPRQKPGSGPKQGQRPGSGQKQGRGPGQGQKARPGQKAGPRSDHGPAVPLRSRKEKKDNMKPKHPDEQEIPFRLRELMRSREAMKRPELGKRRAAEKKQQQQQQQKSKGPKAPGDIPVPRFRRGKGESERSYICRMEQEVQHILFLTENQVQREPEKEATAPEKSKRKKEFQKKKLEKARKKKAEKKEDMLEKSLFQDTVPFGEVVTQPPTITSLPRGQGPAKQAGRKQLLLTPRLGRSQASLTSPVSPVSPVMSMARQRILEEERLRVIKAYRDIQRRKQLEWERTQAGHRVTR